MPSRWCAWCGKPVVVGVVVAGVVVYHLTCWWCRARVIAECRRYIADFETMLRRVTFTLYQYAAGLMSSSRNVRV